MKKKELISKLSEASSVEEIALVECVTNEHIYDWTCDYIHISGDDNFYEIYFTLMLRFLLKYIYARIRFFLWKLFKKEAFK